MTDVVDRFARSAGALADRPSAARAHAAMAAARQVLLRFIAADKPVPARALWRVYEALELCIAVVTLQPHAKRQPEALRVFQQYRKVLEALGPASERHAELATHGSSARR